MAVSTLLIVARGVHFASVMVLFGGLAFVKVIVEPTHRDARDEGARENATRRQLTLALSCLGLSMVSMLAWLAATAAGMSGDALASALGPANLRVVLLQTRFGEAWLARIALAALVGALLLWWRAQVVPAVGAGWLALALAAALLGSLAFVGHAGAVSGALRWPKLANDIVHLLATAAWLGGLAGLVELLRFAPRAEATVCALSRFSLLGILVVTAIVATGAVNTWAVARSVGALLDSTYGALLGVKLCLVCAMVLLACVNRAVLATEVPGGDVRATAALRRSVGLELAIGFAVVAVVGALGVTAPG